MSRPQAGRAPERAPGAGSSIRPGPPRPLPMAQLVTLANAVLAVLPAATVFFLAYGRYDGTFRDNVVFIYFIGGLLMGGLLGFISLVALGSGIGPLLIVLLLALFYPVAVMAGINRRKWQGERHAIFNGGAFGLGIAVMVSFTFLYRLHQQVGVDAALRGTALAASLAGLFFGMGLLAGDAVRRRVQLRTALFGTAILFAPAVFMVEYFSTQTWLWLALLLAYGAVFALLAERRLLVEGVADEARKQRRRVRRREA